MTMRDESTRQYSWGLPQRTFHWLMAALIVVAVPLGLYASRLTPGVAPRPALLEIHKSLGMAILLLLPLRLIWRALAGEPKWREAPTRLVRAASHGAHALIYLGMAVLPFSGYVTSAAGGHSIPFFGLFSFPVLLGKDKALASSATTIHQAIAYAFIALVVLHLAAVIWHRLKGDETLARMAPGLGRR